MAQQYAQRESGKRRTAAMSTTKSRCAGKEPLLTERELQEYSFNARNTQSKEPVELRRVDLVLTVPGNAAVESQSISLAACVCACVRCSPYAMRRARCSGVAPCGAGGRRHRAGARLLVAAVGDQCASPDHA